MDDKVYTPETISENPFPPQDGMLPLGETQSIDRSEQSYGSEKIKAQPFPRRVVAVELLAAALNTRTRKILGAFEFTPSGAIQIGNYQEGVTGDIRISANGLVTRNVGGYNTLVIDGETGDITMIGTLQAGSVIAGQVIVGNNTWIIDGDSDTPNIALYDDSGNISIYLGEV